jgi:hypothetical protein
MKSDTWHVNRTPKVTALNLFYHYLSFAKAGLAFDTASQGGSFATCSGAGNLGH